MQPVWQRGRPRRPAASAPCVRRGRGGAACGHRSRPVPPYAVTLHAFRLDVNPALTVWQDKHDDVKAGIRSTALTFGARTKAYCAGFGAASVALLAATGQAAGCGPAYYAGARGGAERHGGLGGSGDADADGGCVVVGWRAPAAPAAAMLTPPRSVCAWRPAPPTQAWRRAPRTWPGKLAPWTLTAGPTATPSLSATRGETRRVGGAAGARSTVARSPPQGVQLAQVGAAASCLPCLVNGCRMHLGCFLPLLPLLQVRRPAVRRHPGRPSAGRGVSLRVAPAGLVWARRRQYLCMI